METCQLLRHVGTQSELLAAVLRVLSTCCNSSGSNPTLHPTRLPCSRGDAVAAVTPGMRTNSEYMLTSQKRMPATAAETPPNAVQKVSLLCVHFRMSCHQLGTDCCSSASHHALTCARSSSVLHKTCDVLLLINVCCSNAGCACNHLNHARCTLQSASIHTRGPQPCTTLHTCIWYQSTPVLKHRDAVAAGVQSSHAAVHVRVLRSQQQGGCAYACQRAGEP